MQHKDLISTYDTLSIKKLPEHLRKNGFDYKLICRTNEVCLYSQSNGGRIVAYELFHTKIGDQHKAKERWNKLQHKETDLTEYEKYYEIFPSDEEFGKRAWTYGNLNDAKEAFNVLIKAI